MNRQAKKALEFSVFFSIVMVLFLAGLAMADIANFAGDEDDSLSTNITTFNEDLVHLLQFTVNNTDGENNITAVNVTLPSSIFTLGEGSNISTGNVSAAFGALSLNWTNTTRTADMSGLINGSFGAFFNINLTASTPGKYNISVKIADDADSYTERNLTVHVNDTTAPHIVTFMPGIVSGKNFSIAEIILNISANDTHSGIGSANFSIWLTNDTYNANNGARNSSIVHSGGGALNDTFWANFSGSHLVDGNYIINITNINDNSDLSNLGINSTNSTGVQLNITIDTTSPAVSLAKSSTSTETKIVIDVTVTESGTGVEGECGVDTNGLTVTGDGTTSQTITDEDSGFSCGNSREYTVTCTDYSGNSGSTTATFSTDSCSSGGGSSGGDSGTDDDDEVVEEEEEVMEEEIIADEEWETTHNYADTEFSEVESLTQELVSLERVEVMISGESHSVGLVEIGESNAKLQISTEAVQSDFVVGESQKFDVTGDGFYDLLVTLDSIEAESVSVTVSYIHEEVSVAPEESQGIGLWTWIIVVLIVVAVIFWLRKRK